MPGKCTKQDLEAVEMLEGITGTCIDPELAMGCVADAPYGNSAFAEDHLPQQNTPAPVTPFVPKDYEPEFGDVGTIGGFFTPGPATMGGIDLVDEFIRNGVDGEEDHPAWQAARAIPGALGFGAAMLAGRPADMVINFGGLIGRGIDALTD